MNNYDKLKTLVDMIMDIVKRHSNSLPTDFIKELNALIDAFIRDEK